MNDFVKNSIRIQRGDKIYLFSDGLSDQFGGKVGKKFLTKRFKQLLFEINPLSMGEQKEIIKKAWIDIKFCFWIKMAFLIINIKKILFLKQKEMLI